MKVSGDGPLAQAAGADSSPLVQGLGRGQGEPGAVHGEPGVVVVGPTHRELGVQPRQHGRQRARACQLNHRLVPAAAADQLSADGARLSGGPDPQGKRLLAMTADPLRVEKW